VIQVVNREQLVDDGQVALVKLRKPVTNKGFVFLGGHRGPPKS
jgi:hypothetical protein